MRTASASGELFNLIAQVKLSAHIVEKFGHIKGAVSKLNQMYSSEIILLVYSEMSEDDEELP